MSEFSKEVAEKYRSLFEGYSFNFEGLKERTKESFVKLVKAMGAEVSDDAEFTFVEKSYFQKKENNTKDYLYDINYIVNAVENVDAGNIFEFKLAPIHNHQVSSDEPMCYTARFVLKTDSCHKCYYEKVFCKDCAESKEEFEKDSNQHATAIATHSNAADSSIQSEDEIATTPKKKVEINRSDSLKRLISSESEDNSNDEVQTKTVNSKNKSPPRKKLKSSSDTDETLNEHMSLESVVENNDSRSDTKSLNNSGKEKNGKSTKKKSKEIKSLIEQRAVTSNSNESSVEDDDLRESSIDENKKQTQEIDKKGTAWIIPAKITPPSREEKPDESTDEESDVTVDTNNKEDAYFKTNKWWIPHDVPEKEKCTIPNCTYERDPHRAHYKPRRFLSLVEKKILVKYLINNNRISHAKGKSVFLNMIRDGYLSHRTWETLRNCFRRTILKEIKTYNLDELILDKFLELEKKEPFTVKKEN